MKKVKKKKLLTVLCLLCLLVNINQTAAYSPWLGPPFKEFHDGFMGLSWGTPYKQVAEEMALVQAQGLRKRCVIKTYTSNVHGIAVQKIEYLFFKEKFSSVEIILKEDFEYAKKLAAEPEFKIFLMGKSPPSDHPYDKVRSFYKGVAWKNSCGRCVNLFQSKEGDVLRIYVELPYIN